MEKKYALSLFIFRRDLRLHDNTALIAALKNSTQVIPCFIFDKRQLENNTYRSDNCVQFMLESLRDLEQQLKQQNARLFYFYGLAEEVIEQLITTKKIDAVFLNEDYTPFSRHRDQQIKKICEKQAVTFMSFHDLLLHPPKTILKPDGSPYTVFSYYAARARLIPVQGPVKNTFKNYYVENISQQIEKNIFEKILPQKNSQILLSGGRTEALQLLQRVKDLTAYAELRNFPAVSATTHLSAHNKFGTLSIREFFYTVCCQLNETHTLISELFWRDFFTLIGFYFPHVFGKPFHAKYTNIAWENDRKKFQRWCDGQTGFPIIDAGMREMNATGYMHNRVRMLVGSFLTKDLHISWRWGEKYFAQKLIDYDPAVNNGNWQWAASTGCDAQPYFRIFNPWLQQKKYDPDCEYIKRWLPELENVPAQTIHKLYHSSALAIEYPNPMLDHAIESRLTKSLYNVKNVL